ncbi:alpha/beta-hydrolase [Parathielavia appendiculata]|uniref:Alpha/beta-hydrolase n=1 Tax=Parathielavia appendiculata TaxID=2587402 RepID=A0AAN6UB00_9PEZI|nr:alpha/beta-hydrolase [Parathielavia appendiculata]
MQAPVCRDCFTGTLRGDVTPTGREKTIHSVPTYVVTPDPGVTPLGTVVILTDAFGWKLRNTRALADAYAKRVPCTVYVPDFLEGRAIPESTLPLLEAKPPPPTANLLTRALDKVRTSLSLLFLLPILVRLFLHNRRALAYPRIQAFMTAQRTAFPSTKLGVAGFCWGGLHAVLLTHDTPANKVVVSVDDYGGGVLVVEYPLVDCAFTAHPAQVCFPADLEAVMRPLSVANGDNDEWMGRDKMRTLVGILKRKNAELGEERHEAVVYPGAKHGFAVRGDPGDPMQRERGEQSEEQAVKWFRRWLG